ncbi:MAG: EamA family transporter [Actinobacteria bacterium]|nr:EamA family transporter [Actinomycetota bacterium]
MGALLALASAAVFGAADFTGGYATRKTPILTVTLIANVAALFIAAAIVAVVGGVWTPRTVGWSAAAGVCGLTGITFLYLGLAQGPHRIVSPMTAVVSAIIPVVFGLITQGLPDLRVAIGIALAAPAIWLVAGGDGAPDGDGDGDGDLGARPAGYLDADHGKDASTVGPVDPAMSDVVASGSGTGRFDQRALKLTLAAGLGFGLFFVCMAQTGDDAGAVPLIVAKATSTIVVVVVAYVRRRHMTRPNGLGLPILAGTLDMTANGLFLAATRHGDLATVGALTNLFPVTTVLLAVIVLRERLTLPQVAGLLLAITAAALLS